MRLGLPELCDVNVLQLLVGLDEAGFHLYGLGIVSDLVTGVLDPAEEYLGQVRILFVNRDRSPRQDQILEVIFGLLKTDILGLVKIGADAHRLRLVRHCHSFLGLVDETNGLGEVLVEDSDECPYESQLRLIKYFKQTREGVLN